MRDFGESGADPTRPDFGVLSESELRARGWVGTIRNKVILSDDAMQKLRDTIQIAGGPNVIEGNVVRK